MDIHGENAFKSKSYASAAFNIDKLQLALSDLDVRQIASIQGIGSSSAQKIAELLETGKIESLEKLIQETPPGILEMLQIKGVGPKKIHVIWKEMGIESIGELLYACEENRLKLYKGFGEKTQQNIRENIQFYLKSQGSHLYAYAELLLPGLESLIKKALGSVRFACTGKFKRQLETVEAIEFLVAAEIKEVKSKLIGIEGLEEHKTEGSTILYKTGAGIDLCIHCAADQEWAKELVLSSASDTFRIAFLQEFAGTDFSTCFSEEEIFKKVSLPFIPACLREEGEIIEQARIKGIPELIALQDVRGLIHCHSQWSDGSNSIEELALHAMASGLEYMVISDHSKSAFYAQGLQEDRILAQHAQIDSLNSKLKPFHIFKSIECDILNDGRLDYSDQVLAGFDLIIASVHSNLKMPLEKAMARLIRAIENPFTTILGHPTGRLLLSRNGYPVDHKKIIDACAANHVAIELNANPNRLDLDWRYISYAIEKNVLISINPDAHVLEGVNDIRYGVLQAQKAMVSPAQNLSSFGLQAFREHLQKIKQLKGI
jgi:DNA polymerase (family 10)